VRRGYLHAAHVGFRGSYAPCKGLPPLILKAFFKDAAPVAPLGESL
jgi:hypothetical protein